MLNQKLNYISLKKTRNLPKNNDNGPFYLLPVIDKSIINTAYQKSTSILTRFITDEAEKLIKTTEEDLKKPAFLRNIKKKIKNNSMMKAYLKNRNRKKIQISHNITITDDKNETEKSEENKEEKQGEKEKDKDKNNKTSDKIFLTTQDTKSSSHSNNFLNKTSTDTNFYRNNDNLNKNQSTFYNKGGYSFGFGGGLNRKFESSMSLDRELTKGKYNYYHALFRVKKE